MNVTMLFTAFFVLATTLCSSEKCEPPTKKEMAEVKRTSLHEAAAKGDLVKVKHYVCNGFRINRQDYQGRTPLHVATGAEVINYLIDKGARVNARNYQGESPLYYSIAHQWEAIQPQKSLGDGEEYEISLLSTEELKGKLELLMEKGARIDRCDYEGMTILHFLAKELPGKEGYSDILNFLMKKGASPAMKEPNQGNTPLHFAAENNNLIAAEIFLKNNKAAANVENVKCLMPLDCVKKENLKKWEALFAECDIKNGISTNVYEKEYPLHHAVATGNLEFFKQKFGEYSVDFLKKKMLLVKQSCIE